MKYNVTVEITCIVSVEGEDERAAEENAFRLVSILLMKNGVEAGDMTVTDTEEAKEPEFQDGIKEMMDEPDALTMNDADLRDASQPAVAAFLEAAKDLSPEIVQATVGRLIWITSDREQRNALREQMGRETDE